MTVSSATSRKTFAGNGSTTSFATSPLVFFDSAELTVYVITTATGAVVATLVENTDYTVSGGDGSTGTLDLSAGSDPYGAPASGTTLVIVRTLDITQETDHVNNDGSDGEVAEDALDRLTMIAQQLDARLDRAIVLPDSDVAGLDVELPVAGTRASKVLGFDADGDVAMYDSSSSVTVGSNVTTIQTGSGATSRTVTAKLNDEVHVKDFGAVCDGTTDDTASVVAAIAALTSGGTLRYDGTPLLSSKVTIDKKIRLVGAGAAGSNGSNPASYFIKKSTMTATALEITAVGTEMIGGGVVGQAGNTGDNIHILARSVHLDHVYSSLAGNDGVAIGAPAAATDCNYWRATGCHFYDNGRDGLHVESTTPNANAGMAVACVADENTRDGYRVTKGHTNVFLNCNGSGNDGWGFYNDTAEYTVLIGGDYESNTADGTNQIYNSANASFFTVMGLRPEFPILDESFTKVSQPFNILTKRLDQFVEIEMDWQPVLGGSTTAAKTLTAISRTTTTLTFSAVGHGYAVGEAAAIEGTGTLFDGGYIVASAPTADTFTASVSAARAKQLPASWSGSASAYLGYDATVAGRWSRRGNDVYVQGHIVADNVALDATVTGNLVVRGFPYPSENVSNQLAMLPVLEQNVVYPASVSKLVGYISPNAYFMNLAGVGTDLAVQAVPVGATGFRITGALTFSGHYRATPYTL